MPNGFLLNFKVVWKYILTCSIKYTTGAALTGTGKRVQAHRPGLLPHFTLQLEPLEAYPRTQWN